MVTHSATLAANERIRARIAAGAPVLHLAFGEAGLPVHPELAAVLAGATHRTDYPPVVGDARARETCARYFARRGLSADSSRIVLAPGSKALLYALVQGLPGDVVLPQPSWVSYAAQAALAGRRTWSVATPAHTGGIPDPQRLREVLAEAKKAGGRPGTLIMTRPDNPTGTVAPDEDVKAVCEIARDHDLMVISDEIYADLTHAAGTATYPTSPATLVPERTIVTTGLSKRLALGGWRIGVALVPPDEPGSALMPMLIAVGSEVWSAMPAPMQEVAAYAFAEPPEMQRYVEQARRLHADVAHAMWRVWVEAGAECREPRGGFYCYPDLGSFAPRLRRRGVTTSPQLAELLLENYDVGVLPGAAFGDDPSRLAVRVATSLLYGAGVEQRRDALASDSASQLPWVRAALDRLRRALDDLLG